MGLFLRTGTGGPTEDLRRTYVPLTTRAHGREPRFAAPRLTDARSSRPCRRVGAPRGVFTQRKRGVMGHSAVRPVLPGSGRRRERAFSRAPEGGRSPLGLRRLEADVAGSPTQLLQAVPLASSSVSSGRFLSPEEEATSTGVLLSTRYTKVTRWGSSESRSPALQNGAS